MSVVSVTVFSALLWRHSSGGMVTWLALRLGFSVAAVALLDAVAQRDWQHSRQLSAVHAVLGGSGIVWGLIPLFVQPSAPEWRAVVAMWLFGNQSTITAVCAPSRPAFRWGIGTVTIVGAASVLTVGDSYSLVLAGILGLGGLFSTAIFSSVHQAVLSAIRGELKTTALASELEQQQSELRRVNQELMNLASRDSLTQLPNRRTFVAEVADEHGCLKVPTILGFVDLDKFKPVNDSFGHAAGDVVLQRVAQRWSRVLPSGALLARMGGDEFALHMAGFDQDMAEELAARLVRSLEEPIELGQGDSIQLSCSVGLAAAHSGERLASVLRRADDALYEIKEAGGGAFTSRQHSRLVTPVSREG